MERETQREETKIETKRDKVDKREIASGEKERKVFGGRYFVKSFHRKLINQGKDTKVCIDNDTKIISSGT